MDYNRLSPQHHYLDVYEAPQGAAGGWGESYYDNLSSSQYEPVSTGGLSSSLGRYSIPIEATDDITELQTVFINSLQLNQQ